MSPNCPHCPLQVNADGTKHASTLSGQFRHSLESLMKALSACHPVFIRCFKPNSHKQPKVFESFNISVTGKSRLLKPIVKHSFISC